LVAENAQKGVSAFKFVKLAISPDSITQRHSRHDLLLLHNDHSEAITTALNDVFAYTNLAKVEQSRQGPPH
jgi:hypothetical protein